MNNFEKILSKFRAGKMWANFNQTPFRLNYGENFDVEGILQNVDEIFIKV